MNAAHFYSNLRKQERQKALLFLVKVPLNDHENNNQSK